MTETRSARGGVLVLGGGFAGAYAAHFLGARGATIVSPENFMLFTPMLPEAASGTLEPRHVVVPLRMMCPHAELVLARATAHDAEARRVQVRTDEGLFWIRYEELVVALGAIVGGAHIFVEQVLHVADSLGVEPLVLALVLAPIATELPEKANSFFWVREGKDSLALGNITGAMVFQSTLPVSVGLAFTPWELDGYSVVAACLALAGGFIAILTLQIRRRFSGRAILLWATLYAVFVAYVVATA